MEIMSNEPITFNKIYNVLSATHISATQKEQFINDNRTAIDEMMAGKIKTDSFRQIMMGRPLKLFKPLKNVMTKTADKKIFASAMGIEPSEVDDFISEISEEIKNGEVEDISKDKIELVKTYVYRHGKKDDLLNFLDYELASAGDILGVLYRTLQYNTGGAADYFVRPIHRMNNNTLVEMYDIVDTNLKNAARSGDISELDRERTAEWALVRIYEIQNNQKLKNAVKLKRELSL